MIPIESYSLNYRYFSPKYSDPGVLLFYILYISVTDLQYYISFSLGLFYISIFPMTLIILHWVFLLILV